MKRPTRNCLVFTLALWPMLLWGQVNVPHTFRDGDTISAQDMNQNFAAVAAGAPAVYLNVATSWTTAATSTSYVAVPGLSRTLNLANTSTVTVVANGHMSALASGDYRLVVFLDGALFNESATSPGEHEGQGYTESTTPTPITALTSGTVSAGSHTVDIRHSMAASTAYLHGAAMLIIVTP